MILPWCKFFPRDWFGDVQLRGLSYAARGLWADLLCLMAMSERRGFLMVNGHRLTDAAEIARMTSGQPSEVKRLLGQLEAAGVFSRDVKGMIYSRRMVKEAEESERKRIAGKQGGNPALLKQRVKGAEKQAVASALNPRSQKPETRTDDTHTTGASSFPPTLAAVKAEAAKIGMSAAEAKRFWHHYQANEWRDKNGKPLTARTWPHKLQTWTPKGSGPARCRSQSAGKRPSSTWELQKQREAVDAEIKGLEARGHEDNWGVHLRPEDKPRLKQLKQRRADLQKLLAGV